VTISPNTTGAVLRPNGSTAVGRAGSHILRRCRNNAARCPPAEQKFLAVIAEGREHQGRARIGVINRAINMAIEPMIDLAQRGVPDRCGCATEAGAKR
jgi:hypothetical protein